MKERGLVTENIVQVVTQATVFRLVIVILILVENFVLSDGIFEEVEVNQRYRVLVKILTILISYLIYKGIVRGKDTLFLLKVSLFVDKICRFTIKLYTIIGEEYILIY